MDDVWRRWWVPALCALWGACGVDPLAGEPRLAAGADAAMDKDGDALRPMAVPGLGCQRIDVLFVIDNSLSMEQEQANLLQNIPAFVDVLEGFQGGAVDYRLAVTTTALTIFEADRLRPPPPGADGELLQRPECGLTRPWLERGDPELARRFACNAQVELGGSDHEMPLLAARLALVERVADGTNRGFLRDDALLAIVILTDEDDQSIDPSQEQVGAAIPVDAFVEAFNAVKGDPRGWAAAVFAGDQQPSCASPFGTARNALKLRSFVERVGDNAVFSSICAGDLAAGLEQALATFASACDGFPII